MDPKPNHSRFFRSDTGKTMLIPIDHGTLIPVPGLEDTGALIERLKPFTDGFIVNLGVARAFAKELAGSAVVLRTDTGNTCVEGLQTDGSYRIWGPAEAAVIGAHGMMNMCFPGHSAEANIISDCADLIAESLSSPYPIMLETLPYGLGRGPDYTPEAIHYCIRLSCELGADIVKTAYPGDKEAFRRSCEEAFAPVIVLGGASGGSPREFLDPIADAMEAGAAGIAVGRNLWQAPDPVRMAKALNAIVHAEATAEDAWRMSA
ncbi:MAG: hypothetical protein AAF514_11310 [Verrucomicrobiota bacterium]